MQTDPRRVLLGVNIDHVATVRQARGTDEPDPVHAAVLAELGGADSITVHLREDRRHIQDRDVRLLAETLRVPMNFEMAVAEEMTHIACQLKPHQASLVPEKREEVTTEGGLDVVGQRDRVAGCVDRLREAGVIPSLFIDPDESQIRASHELGVDAVELHTGRYADAGTVAQRESELRTLVEASAVVRECGMKLHAGHGLTYRNVEPVAAIEGMRELNIGHSIVSRAVLVGFERAVREMRELVTAAGR